MIMPRISSHRYQIDVVIVGVAKTLVLRKSQKIKNPYGQKSRWPEVQMSRSPDGQKSRRPDGQKSRWPEVQMARSTDGQKSR